MWNDRMPILLHPCGAAPKETAPFYHLITDARSAKKLYSDWGTTYTTPAISAARPSCATSTSPYLKFSCTFRTPTICS